MSKYVRIPKQLKELLQDEYLNQANDVYGVEPRLEKIVELIKTNPLIIDALSKSTSNRVVDLGGNSGYFSFGLISSGIASSALVIDSNPTHLDEGMYHAQLLAYSDMVQFQEKVIDLDYVRNEMPSSEILLLNNLLHHAGYLFDNELVRSMGWGNYLVEFLDSIYTKTEVVVLGVGLKRSLPLFWLRPNFLRLGDDRYWHLFKLVQQSSWNICHFAFVDKLDVPLNQDLPKWKRRLGRFLEPIVRLLIVSRAWLETKSGFKLRPSRLDQRKFYVLMLLVK